MHRYLLYLGLVCFFSGCMEKLDEELNSNPFDQNYTGGPQAIISGVELGETFEIPNDSTAYLQVINVKIDILFPYALMVCIFKAGKEFNCIEISHGQPKVIYSYMICVDLNSPADQNCVNKGTTFVFQAALKKGGKYAERSEEYSFTLP